MRSHLLGRNKIKDKFSNIPYVAIEFLSTQTCRIVPVAKGKVVNVAEIINGSHLRASISKSKPEISTLDTSDQDKTKNPISCVQDTFINAG